MCAASVPMVLREFHCGYHIDTFSDCVPFHMEEYADWIYLAKYLLHFSTSKYTDGEQWLDYTYYCPWDSQKCLFQLLVIFVRDHKVSWEQFLLCLLSLSKYYLLIIAIKNAINGLVFFWFAANWDWFYASKPWIDPQAIMCSSSPSDLNSLH